MKIPTKFTLGAIDWKVKLVDELGDRSGQCDSSKALILLEKNTNKQVLAQAFCHEYIHALFYHSGKVDDHDELLVEGMANGLHQYLVDTYEDL